MGGESNMNLSHIIVILLLICTVSAVVVMLMSRRKQRRTLVTLNRMIDAAISGTFTENTYDESLLSSVEARFAQYLRGMETASKKLAKDKDKIKELISDISHQTKTPISNIMLYSQLLSEQTLSPECEACVNTLNKQALKLNFLIDSLVKTSRLETDIFTLHPTINEIIPMLKDICKQVEHKALEKEIKLVISPTKECAYFDYKWTSEAILNILDNAIKYSSSGTSILIRVISYELFCRIDIEDNGIGIAVEEQSKIFKRFYRSPNVSTMEGVGIGLYLSRQIISKEGGYIKLSSVIGKGSTFSTFLLKQKPN